VLHREVLPLHKVFDFWGKNANKLKKTADKKEYTGFEWCTVFDYWDMDTRRVWGVIQQEPNRLPEPDGGETIIDGENELGFIPWAVKDGGKDLRPFLYPIYKSGAWDTHNLLLSLQVHEMLAYYGAPRVEVTGPSPDGVEVEYGQMGSIRHVSPAHEAKDLQPPAADTNMMAQFDRYQDRITTSTLSRLVQSGEIPSGAAFATIRELITLGTKKLNSAKELAEEILAEIFHIQLSWYNFTKDKIVTTDSDGREIAFNGDMFDSDYMSMTVELTADLPVDQVARMNAASSFVQALNGSRKDALEMIGFQDPDDVIGKRRQEDVEEMEHQMQMQERQAMQQMKIERAVTMERFKTQMQIQQMQMQGQQMQMQQQQMQMQQPPMVPQGEPPVPIDQGQGANPAEGGMAPIRANPTGIREIEQERQGLMEG
jgi:hypothetical protein